jgi:hypothetical protein
MTSQFCIFTAAKSAADLCEEGFSAELAHVLLGQVLVVDPDLVRLERVVEVRLEVALAALVRLKGNLTIETKLSRKF